MAKNGRLLLVMVDNDESINGWWIKHDVCPMYANNGSVWSGIVDDGQCCLMASGLWMIDFSDGQEWDIVVDDCQQCLLDSEWWVRVMVENGSSLMMMVHDMIAAGGWLRLDTYEG